MFLIRPRNPAHYPHAAVDRAPHYLETWLRHFPDSTPDTIDFEDWVENACYFYHLQDQPHEILRNSKGIGFVSGAAFANCGALLQGDMNAPASIMLGTWLNSDGVTPIQHRSRLVGNSPAVVRSVVNYASSPVFRAHAGRPFMICSGSVIMEDGSGIGQQLEILHAQGHREIFLKTRVKDFAGRFTLPDMSRGPAHLWDCLVEQCEDLEWYPIQYEEMPNIYLLQTVIEPTYEYRVIVVDDLPVTGTGCVEAHPPLDNENRFNTAMEAVRNQSPVVRRKDLARQYKEWAGHFAAAIRAEFSEAPVYSLDLCVDAISGNIVPIELNPFMNLGLYGTDVGALIDALEALMKS